MNPRLLTLIIDEERSSQLFLRRLLESHNYRVNSAFKGATGIREASACRHHAIIMDLDLPDMDGTKAIARLRKCCSTPVLILTARRDESDVVSALDRGANAYMTKPFSAEELLARLRVLLRTIPGASHKPLLTEGSWTVDITTHIATFREHKIALTATEATLFYFLLQNVDRGVTCSQLLHSIWGGESDGKLNCLRVYITNLRKKLGTFRDQVVVQTEGTRGYKLILCRGHATVLQPLNDNYRKWRRRIEPVFGQAQLERAAEMSSTKTLLRQ